MTDPTHTPSPSPSPTESPSPTGSPTEDKGTHQVIMDGYGTGTLVALGLLVAVYAFVFWQWGFLIVWDRGIDFLLVAIWMFMTWLLTWNIDAKRDLPLAFVAFLGGGVIEWWGTTTEIWHYFTHDRPPLWILPAWPIAALAVDRLTIFVDRKIPADMRLGWAYWTMIPMFVIGMSAFSWHTRHVLSTCTVIGLMVGVALSTTNIRRDVVLFLAGSGLGIFLEYWGTSRFCWTYYTQEIPPPVAIVAHGFASIAFNRALEVGQWARSLLPGRHAPAARLH